LPTIEPAEQVVRLPQVSTPDADEPTQKPS